MRIEHDLFNSKNYARLQCFCPLQSDGKERTGQVLCERQTNSVMNLNQFAKVLWGKCCLLGRSVNTLN